MDRLPEELIHHILSFLSPEKVAETSVLSKTWYRAWSTYPDFVFSEPIFWKSLTKKSCSKLGKRKFPNLEDSKKMFVKFVNDNLQRYSNHNLPIDKFELDLSVYDHEIASQIDKWLGMVVYMTVRHLSLRFDTRKMVSYTLPALILASNRLTSLTLQGNRRMFQSNIVTRFTLENHNCSVIKCYNLKSVTICSVYFDEEMFQSLCSSCPLIEQLKLKDCFGLKTIQVRNLRNLLDFNVSSSPRGQIVHIFETPSLEKFCIFSISPFTITSFSSQALKYMHLCQLSITDVSLGNLVSQCPLLEDLHLIFCNSLERVHLLSRTLKNMVIVICDKLVEARIDAPNLLFVRYVADGVDSFSFKSLSKKFKSTVDIRVTRALDVALFAKIKDMLTELKCCEFLLTVTFGRIGFNIEDLRQIPLIATPKRIHKLRMRIVACEPSTYSALAHGLFWSCHPEIVEVRFPEEINYGFTRHLCKELMDRTSLKCCSSDHQVMCWRHCLTHVEVECLERVDRRTKPRRQPFDWKRLVDGSITPNSLAICFTLNWCVLKCAHIF